MASFQWMHRFSQKDINTKDVYRITPLMYLAKDCSSNSRKELLHYFIDAGADISYCNRYGMNALMMAVMGNDYDTFELLLSRGESAHHCNKYKSNLLMWTAKYSRSEDYRIAEYLLVAGVDINATNRHGTTALMFAVKERNMRMVSYLISRGADLFITDNEGKSLIMHCCINGDKLEESLLRLLISLGCDVRCRDNKGETALHLLARYAILNEEQKRVRFSVLLDAGADVNVQDNDGVSVLLAFICRESDCWNYCNFLSTERRFESTVNICRQLFSFGAEVNSVSKNGDSALTYTLSCKSTCPLKFLLQYGADASKLPPLQFQRLFQNSAMRETYLSHRNWISSCNLLLFAHSVQFQSYGRVSSDVIDSKAGLMTSDTVEGTINTIEKTYDNNSEGAKAVVFGYTFIVDIIRNYLDAHAAIGNYVSASST